MRAYAALTGETSSEASSIAAGPKGGKPAGNDAHSREQRLEMGAPPKKQAQQEEVLAPLDEDERSAVHRRLAARGGGPYATSRGFGGGGGGYGTGRPAPSGSLSPAKQRAAAQTARREQEIRTAREREVQARKRARHMAAVTARLQAEREAAEDARREEARQALAQRRAMQEERQRLAAEAASRNNIPTFGSTIQRAMPPPLTEKQILRKKRQARPEWGSGHAGGYKLKAQTHPRPSSASQAARLRSQCHWDAPSATDAGARSFAPPVARQEFHGSTYAHAA